MSAPNEFPGCHEQELRAHMERAGARAVIDYIESLDGADRRRELYSFAQRTFGHQDWPGKNFDAYIAVVDAGIAEGLRQSRDAGNAEEAAACKDFANRLSYNLAADLAECWPDDLVPRERRHLERGLLAANDCLRWRTELNKPPFPFAIAWWAKGMHELSLGRIDDSIASFLQAFDYAVQSLPAGEPNKVTGGGAFIVIVNAGYLGIARATGGDDAGRKLYDDACAAFVERITQSQDQEQKEDAKFGLAQLRWVARKFIATGS